MCPRPLSALGPLAALAVLAVLAVPMAAHAAAPDLRLHAGLGPHVLTQAGTARELPSRLHLVATGAALELQAQRGDDGRIAVQQRVDGIVRPTAAHSPAFPLGLGGAVRVRVLRLDGSVVLDERRHLCPNAGGQARRVDPLTGVPGGVVAAEVPWSCGYVLARSALWELGRDRAAAAGGRRAHQAQRPLACPTSSRCRPQASACAGRGSPSTP